MNFSKSLYYDVFEKQTIEMLQLVLFSCILYHDYKIIISSLFKWHVHISFATYFELD